MAEISRGTSRLEPTFRTTKCRIKNRRIDFDNNVPSLLRLYESLAYEGIRILALAFLYDAPLRESAGLPAREVISCPVASLLYQEGKEEGRRKTEVGRRKK